MNPAGGASLAKAGLVVDRLVGSTFGLDWSRTTGEHGHAAADGMDHGRAHPAFYCRMPSRNLTMAAMRGRPTKRASSL